ncbi:MAG: DUF455 family protein [Alteraurantiacibacter sp.]
MANALCNAWPVGQSRHKVMAISTNVRGGARLARNLDMPSTLLAHVGWPGDSRGTRLERILDGEIRHVTAGSTHLARICKAQVKDWQECEEIARKRYFHGALKPPFNDSARFAGGLPREIYAGVA